MQLFDSQLSPFCRKVRVVLHETGQADDVELVTTKSNPMDVSRDLAARNPLAKMPTLLRDDGFALYDSRVICRFLDARAEAGLYPEHRLWQALTLEATGDGIMDSAVQMYYEGRYRAEDSQQTAWVEGQWGKIEQSLTALESLWMSHLAGPLDIGQISVGCALGYIDLRHPARGWRATHGALADWCAGFAERPSMQATKPEQ